MPTARQIFNAAGAQRPVQALESLGLPKPQTYKDIWRTMRAAYDAMTPDERRIEDAETRARLNYLSSASKAPGAQPKMYDGRYTKGPKDDA